MHLPVAVFLFLLGAAASLVGDHSHIVTGTTEYLSDAVPFAWSSPIWFPILVGLATVSIAELRLHLPAARPSVTARQGLAGVAAVLGIYVTTAAGAQRARGAGQHADLRARGDHLVCAR